MICRMLGCRFRGFSAPIIDVSVAGSIELLRLGRNTRFAVDAGTDDEDIARLAEDDGVAEFDSSGASGDLRLDFEGIFNPEPCVIRLLFSALTALSSSSSILFLFLLGCVPGVSPIATAPEAYNGFATLPAFLLFVTSPSLSSLSVSGVAMGFFPSTFCRLERTSEGF
jgi:hypothetical protein